MSEIDPVPPPPSSPAQSAEPTPTSPAPPKPRRRARRWAIVAVVALLFIVGIVLLLPTLASTTPVRSYVVSKVNADLNGRLQVDGWSLGWTSGVKARGLKLYDAAGVLILDVGRFETGLSLMDVLRGNYDLGQTTLDGVSFLARRDADGEINFNKLTKKTPVEKSTSPPPGDSGKEKIKDGSRLPDVRGEIVLKNAHGTYEDVPKRQSFQFRSIDGHLKIPDINAPIENSFTVVGSTGAGGDGTLSINGSIDAVDGNVLRVERAAGNEAIVIKNFALMAVEPFLPPGSLSALRGQSNGSFTLKLDPSAGGVIEGNLVTTNLSATGASLHGDTFATDELALVIPRTTVAAPSSGGDWLSSVVTIGDGAQPLSLQWKQANGPAGVTLSGRFTPRALQNALDGQSGQGSGDFTATANVDLGELASKLPRTLAQYAGESKLTSGALALQTKAAYQGADVSTASRATLTNVTLVPPAATGRSAAPTLQNYNLALDLAAQAKQTAEGLRADVSTLSLKDDQPRPMLSVAKGNGAFSILLPTSGKPQATGSLRIDADLARLNQIAQSFSSDTDDGPQLQSARLSGEVAVSSAAADSTAVNGKLDLSEIRVKTETQSIDNERLGLTLALKAQNDFKRFAIDKISAAGGLFNLDVTNTVVQLPADNANAAPWDMAPNATAELRVPNLGKAWDFISTLNRPMPIATAAKPPTQLRDGSLNVKLTMARQADGPALVADVNGQNIAYRTGAVSHALGPVAMNAEVRLTPRAAPTAGATVMERIAALSVPRLTVAAANSRLELAKPLTVSDVSALLAAIKSDTGGSKPSTGAPISVEAALNGTLDLATLQSAFEGLSGERQPDRYAGRVDLQQTVSTGTQGVTLAGRMNASDFRVTSATRSPFAEKMLGLSNDVTLDSAASALRIKDLSVDTQTSKALRLRVIGNVSDLSTKRRLENVVVDADYDAANLLKMAAPLLASPPAAAARGAKPAANPLDEIRVAGNNRLHLELSGAYPADRPFFDAIRSLAGKGSVGLEEFDGYGLTITKFNLGLDLQQGKVNLTHPGGYPSVNGGAINLGGAAILLGDRHPRLYLPPNHGLARNVSINPVLADSVIGRFVNPLFENAARAQGLVDVTVVKCDGLALDYLRNSPIPAESGRAELTLSLRDLFLGVPKLASQVNGFFPNAFNNDGFEAAIENAKVVIEGGKVMNELTLVADKQYKLNFNGGIGLQQNQLINFNMSIPPSLVARLNKSWAKYVPEQGLSLQLTGSTDNWSDNLAQSVQPIIGQLASKALGDKLVPGLGGAIPGIGGRPGAKGEPETRPATPEDAIGGLLDDLLGGKKETDEEKRQRRERVRQERAQKQQSDAQQNADEGSDKKKSKARRP